MSTNPNHPRSRLPIPAISAFVVCAAIALFALVVGDDRTSADSPKHPTRLVPTVSHAATNTLPTGLDTSYYTAASEIEFESWPTPQADIVPGFLVASSMFTGLDGIENMPVNVNDKRILFSGWQDGVWQDVSLSDAMRQTVASDDDGTVMRKCAVVTQRMELGGTAAEGVFCDDSNATITVSRFESARHAHHFMVATAATQGNWSGSGSPFVFLHGEYNGLGDVNLTKRLSAADNPGGSASFDFAIMFSVANIVVMVEMTPIDSDPLAAAAEVAFAIHAPLANISLVSPIDIDDARPEIAITLSKDYLYAGEIPAESHLSPLLKDNYCGLELDVTTTNNNAYKWDYGYTECELRTLPTPGGTPALLRAAYEAGEFPVAFCAFDLATMIPNVSIIWIQVYGR